MPIKIIIKHHFSGASPLLFYHLIAVYHRYVDEPTLDGQSIDHVDSYTNAYNERVHYTSGIYNKAFYTLSTKPGWGIIKAFKVSDDIRA